MADATVMQRAEATAFDLALPIGDGSTVEPWPFATLFLAPVSTGDSHGEGRIPGVESVPPMLRGRGNPGLAVLRLGPFEALLVSETGADFPVKAGFTENSFIEISHSLVGYYLRGAQAEAVLALGCPIDMHPRAFPVGMVTRTLFAKFDIILWRTGVTEFRLLVARSASLAFLAHLRMVFPHVAA